MCPPTPMSASPASSELRLMNGTWAALILPSIAFGVLLTVLILGNLLRDVPQRADVARWLQRMADRLAAGPRAHHAGDRHRQHLQRPRVWNGFHFSLILAQSPNLRATAGAVEFEGEYGTNAPAVLAAVVVSTLPVLVL